MDDLTVARPTESPQPLAGEGNFAPGTILGGRYRVVSLLGSGGMGTVYRGDDLKLGQRIAMKFLRGISAERERQLYEEVRIGRQISHPSVCRLYDITEVDGQTFITMEYVDGEDLASLLTRIGRLPPDKAMRVARDLCAGLAAAHELGVIHRDLKPGNVMIDGRGRARITDFGLAIASQSAVRGGAGTPAYMAPEQLAGEPATMQSDIYALGLVLYEIFTGRRPFSDSLAKRLQEQRDLSLTRPTELVREIDPRVERAILSCLDPDPAARPQSPSSLLRELPSFDPLDAALAAGETPSPAMVAAASERGDLRPGQAWALLALFGVALVGTLRLADRTLVVNRVGELKPPAVLIERARELAAQLRLPQPRDSAWSYLPYANEAVPVQFLYRQSDRAMVSRRFDRLITADDPPLTVSNMFSVSMDGKGRLLELVVVPPQRAAPPPASAPDFSSLIRQAGLEASVLKPAVPVWAAPVDSDWKRAWQIGSSGRRVEAAAYHGRPVWFSVIEPSKKPLRMVESDPPVPQRIASWTVIGILSLLPIVFVALARRNLRRQQGDRRGAVRVALTTFLLALLGTLARAHHPPDARAEWFMLAEMVAETIFWGLAVWTAYVAVEPLVRRSWPRMLVSWSRLLEGRWRDPMVGRDLLIGFAFGATAALLMHAGAAAVDERLITNVSPLGSIRSTLFFICVSLAAQGIARPLLGAVFLVATRAVMRRMDLTLVVTVVVSALGVTHLPGGTLPLRLALALLMSMAVFWIIFRVGLLPIGSAAFTTILLREMPITSDIGSWYFSTTALIAAALILPALAAFWISLSGKSPFPRLALE